MKYQLIALLAVALNMTKIKLFAYIPVLLLIATLLLTTSRAAFIPAQDGYKITVNAAMVSTDVTIIGTPASEMRPEDFSVYDNDVRQPITHFSRNQIPLAVAIVVDRSLTVQEYMPMLQMAAISSLRHLKTEDQVALFAFDYNVQKLCDLTGDRSLIAEKIGKIQNQLGTNIYDAICDSATYLKKKALQSGVSFSLTVPLKAPKQVIKVVIYDELSDKAGSRIIQLR